MSCLRLWSRWRSQFRALVSQPHFSVSYTPPGCRLHSESYVVWPCDMSLALESERDSMSNYSEPTTGNQDYLRNIWMVSIFGQKQGKQVPWTLLCSSVVIGWRHTFLSYFFKVSNFSVLRIELDEQTRLGQVRNNQFSLCFVPPCLASLDHKAKEIWPVFGRYIQE